MNSPFEETLQRRQDVLLYLPKSIQACSIFIHTHPQLRRNLKDFSLSLSHIYAHMSIQNTIIHTYACVFLCARGNTRLSLENIYLLQFSCMNVPCVPRMKESE